MLTYTYKVFFIVAVVFLLCNCKPKLDAPEPGKGNLDVSKYVSLGNSITAGFADAALYYDGQIVSYPNLLAQQFEKIGGGEFRQPLTDMSSIGVGGSGNSKYSLTYVTDCKGVRSLAPTSGPGDFGIFASIASRGPFNNMGVPGAKAITAVYPGYGNNNPLFGRMLESSEKNTASMLGKAADQNPTFFSLFIGNNDVLGYASSGGASDAITPSQGAPGVGFDASIDLIVSTLSANGAKGVIANIPDITNLPFFTVVPYNGLILDSAKAAQLTKYYAFAGITFSIGANPFLMIDSKIPAFLGLRKMREGELVLLSTPQDSIKCAGWGATKPLKNQYVLADTEIEAVKTAIGNFNAKLKSVADDKGFAFVNVNEFMNKCKKGIVYNGININTTFVTGGAFSLDGVHLTPIGNALLANEFIKSINSTYKSSIPEVDATKYRGVAFP